MSIAELIEALEALLNAADANMRGADMTEQQREMSAMFRHGAIYGSAAFLAAPDGDSGAFAMARAFLLAVIDPTHPGLDYLRADPATGQIARDASAALSTVTKQRAKP